MKNVIIHCSNTDFLISQSLGEFNDSIPEYRYSLSLEPTSEPVLSVYSSVLCEIRKIESSMEYSRKLDETQVGVKLLDAYVYKGRWPPGV